MKRILIVGGTGKLGLPVAKAFHKNGFSVGILTRNKKAAQDRCGADFEYLEGDVENPASLQTALEGYEAVHINLAGGPTAESYDRIEHRGTAQVADAAKKTGIQHISTITGASVCEENTWSYIPAAKYAAEEAIKRSGLPYTIFRPSWFMESFPLFVRDGRAILLGKCDFQARPVAVDDYAGMVVRAYRTPEAAGRTLYVGGPEKMSFRDAFRKYCAIVHPDISPLSIPIWLFKLIARLTKNEQGKDVASLMAYFHKVTEESDSSEADALLGKAETTLEEWCKRHTTTRD